MIPVSSQVAFEAGLSVLHEFGERHTVRGRFVALFLGLCRMRRIGLIAELGSGVPTAPSQLENFLDDLFTKTHRSEPFVVLTAPFGQSTSATAPWSTRTGEIAPGNTYPTNTWRNNFGIQKGVGCPASPDTVQTLLADNRIRLACPHRNVDSEGRPLCGITGTAYRGDEHSIWLHIVNGGNGGLEVVDLRLSTVFRDYLFPNGQRLPVFALIAVLYAMSGTEVFPQRASVGIPELAEDFGFSLDDLEEMFDCNPDSIGNSTVLSAIDGVVPPVLPTLAIGAEEVQAAPLPAEPEVVFLNSGVGAELAVARDLANHGWTVGYWGSRRGAGYDLEARRAEAHLRIEVKSSVGFCTPELTEEEWNAAQEYADDFVLAMVDFFGSPTQRVSYLRNPAANVTPAERSVLIYRIPRVEALPLSTSAEFL
ncbi:MAG: protein NO VEIN domain-containing protein [Alphaproteobacteria bacterium]